MYYPKFTWWPWRIMACGVPVLAAALALIANEAVRASNSATAENYTTLIFLTMLGAGNGILIAAAIGDFGRTVAAMFAGSIGAFIAVTALPSGPACGLFVATFIIILTTLPAIRELEVSMSLFFQLFLCVLGTFGLLTLMSSAGTVKLGLQLVLAFPLITLIVTFVLPLEISFSGRLEALQAGALASLQGLTLTLVVIALLIPMVKGISTGVQEQERVFLLLFALGLIAGNMRCVEVLFIHSVRAVDVNRLPRCAEEKEQSEEHTDGDSAGKLESTPG